MEPVIDNTIRQHKQRISLVAIFTGLTIIAVPFSIIAIGGTGILMYTGVPLILLSIVVFFNGTRRKEIIKPVKLLLIFLLYDLFSYAWSPGQPTVFIRTTLVVVCIMVNYYNDKEQKLLFLLAFIPAFINFYNFQTGGYASMERTERLSMVINGVETDPNYLSFSFFPAIVGAVFTMMNTKKRWVSIVSILIILIVFYCELAMGCRAAFLACFVMIFCSFLISKRFSGRGVLGVLLLLVVFYFFIPFVLQLLPDVVADRFSVDNILGAEDNMSNRTVIWEETFNYIMTNPESFIFGRGAGSTQHYLMMASHNAIIQVLFELGIVGLLLFFAFIVSFLVYMWKNDEKVSFPLFVGTVFMSLSLSINGILVFWINIAMVVLFLSYDKNQTYNQIRLR